MGEMTLLVAKLCLTLQPRGRQHGQALLSFTVSQSLLKFKSTEALILSNHLIILRGPLLLLLSVFPIIRVFFLFFVFPSGSVLRMRRIKFQSP